MKEVKKFELYSIFLLFKAGKNSKTISKELNLSKSNLAYYVKKLKDLNVLQYVGKGTWKVIGDYKLVQKSVPTHKDINLNSCRGHAFIWKIQLAKQLKWKELIENKISYKLQSHGKVLRIFFENKKIWLTKDGMIIYEPRDFFGRNAYESKGYAVNSVDLIIKKLFNKLEIPFMFYKFTTSREHFGLVKNELARQFNERGEKLHIINESGTEWLWIDNSLGLGEIETNNVDINKQLQDYWNDQRRTQFKVTPTFLLETINKVVQNQVVFDKNIVKHQKVLDEMSATLKAIRDSLQKS